MPATTRCLRVPARLNQLDCVHQLVRGCAEQAGLGEQAAFACELSADEAFVNIIQHAYGGESDQPVVVRCRLFARALVISFVDEGIAWDPRPPQAPDWTRDIELLTAGGLGRLIMHRAMDRVRFRRRRGRNYLTLCKLTPPDRGAR